MRLPGSLRIVILVALSGALGGLAALPAVAVDGVIEINQARATAGGVTVGDAPGFPVTLGSSGSYRLTGNLTITDGDLTGIEIPADDVHLDLNGFSIKGPISCGGAPFILCINPTGGGFAGDGIRSTGDQVSVVNGSVAGMGRRGLDMAGNSRVERVHATSNGGGGIHLCVSSNDPVAEGCILRSSSAFRNGGQYAVRGGTETLVEGNTITYNAGTGIWLEASTALHNAVHFNQGSGILAVAGLLIGNHVGNNSNYGIEFNGTFSGWRDNVLNANGTGAVNGSSTQLGVNVCVGAPCP